MQQTEEILFTFDSTAHAIAAEQLLLAKGLGVTVMPLPAAIHAGCGICLRLPPQLLPAALQALAQNPGIRFVLYTRSVQGGASRYALYNKGE